MKVLKLLMAALVSSLGISLFTACGGAKYPAEITPVNAYNKKSEPLTADFTTKEIEKTQV